MHVAAIIAWILRGIVAAVFVGMGVNHFRPRAARGMARMIPPRLRGEGLFSPINLVHFTGLCELAGGIGILVPVTRLAAGIGLVLFLIAVFPANAHAAANPERFGRLAIPFWPRLTAQVALIAVVALAATLDAW